MNDGSTGPIDSGIRRTFLRTIPLSLVVAVASLLLFVWIADAVFDQETRQFDDYLRTLSYRHSSPPLTSFMLVVTRLGSAYWLIPAVLVLLAVFVIRNWQREAWLLGITMVGALILDVVLKLSYHRPRPTPFFGISVPQTYAFPSGHALASLCFYGVLAGILALHGKTKWLRWGIWAGSALLIALIGWSRIYLGVHYPSDVIGGYVAAVVWMSGVRLVARPRTHPRQNPRPT